jgi:hypothetical protein
MRRILLIMTIVPLLGCGREPAGDGLQSTVVGDQKPKTNKEPTPRPVWRNAYSGDSDLWEYCVPFQRDFGKVLEELRQREFKAGRFYRSELAPKTINDAIRNGDAAGTQSILDIEKVSATSEPCAVSPALPENLRQLFGTDKPSHAMVETASKQMTVEFQKFLETRGRGEGMYIIMYDGEHPTEIYFAGWSSH